MSLITFLQQVLPLLLNRSLSRVDNELSDGTVKAYWVGEIIRIDFRPNFGQVDRPLTVPSTTTGNSVLIG